MNANWDAQVKRFLRKAGEELRRTSDEVRQEAQRLLSEVKDPEKQRKVKDGLRELGVWAKKTAEEVAEMVEVGVRKAERAWKPEDGASWKPPEPVRETPSAEAPAPARPAEKARAKKPLGPTPGKKASPAKRAPSSGGGVRKKTVGKKKRPSGEG